MAERSVNYKSKRGSSTSESYLGQDDHDEYIGYLRGEHGECVWVGTGKFSDWSAAPVVSEGFYSCFPVIAFQNGRCQFVHFSRDPWRPTDTEEFWKRMKEWQESGCDLTMMQAKQSALGPYEINIAKKMFEKKFCLIDFEVDSRFRMVVDPQPRLALVELSDLKELRRYRV